MGDKSAIQWTDATWSVTYGCTRASAGCDNCYAVGVTRRLSGSLPIARGLVGRGHFNGVVRELPSRLDQPLRWKRPRRVFVNSLSDLFHREVSTDFIDLVFGVMALARHHTFQVLTKRPERMSEYLRGVGLGGKTRRDAVALRRERIIDGAMEVFGPEPGDAATREFIRGRWPLPNVWLGTSTEDQPAADERIPHLRRCPAAIRFVSAEPLIGPLDLSGAALGERWGVQWVIPGGESGRRANVRPCRVEWIRSLVEQCRAAGAACFVKQLGRRPVVRRVELASSLAVECEHGYSVCPECDAGDVELTLGHPKGGDPEEWPTDLRVREYPS